MFYLSSLPFTSRFEGYRYQVWVERSKTFTCGVLIQVQRKRGPYLQLYNESDLSDPMAPLPDRLQGRENLSLQFFLNMRAMALQNNRTKEKKTCITHHAMSKASRKSVFFEYSVNARDFAEILNRH